MLVVAIAAFAAWFPSAASADISSTVTGTFASTTPGASSTYTNVQTFTRTGTPPLVDNDDLRKWILDGPAGQIGNPNAIPFASRCTLDQFDDVVSIGGGLYKNNCPNASVVGVAAVLLVADADGSTEIDANGAYPGLAAFAAAPLSQPSFASTPASVATNGTPGTIYLIQDSPEAPVTLGTYFHLSTATTRSILQPVTSGADGDFRIRVIPADNVSHPALPGPTYASIKAIMQRLHGNSGWDQTGPAWLYNPTRCDDWTTYSYATEYNPAGNTNADSNPDIENPADGYKKSAGSNTTPDCSTLPAFPGSASITLGDLSRGSHPQVDVSVKGVGAMGDDFPKKVVTTLPGSINVDFMNIPADICTTTQRDAFACPASSKIGTATVSTPLITAGLTGDVYMVKIDGKTVPDLAVFFNKPPNPLRPFMMKGSTKYVGANNNQIETTFDNSPQNPMSEFKMTLNGGATGLMKVNSCPTDSSSPEDGPITFNLTGFSGQTASSSSTPALADCFGVAKLKKISKCVKSKLKVSPSYQSRDQISKSELWIKRKGAKKYKRVQTSKKSPFKFSAKLSSRTYKKGKHAYKIRATYKASPAAPGGTVKERTSSFKKC